PVGLNRYIMAWKNIDDPCPGDMSYQLELTAYPEIYIRKGTAIYFRSGPWKGLHFIGSVQLRPNPLYGFNFVSNDEEVYFLYNLTNKSAMSRIVMLWVEAEKSRRLLSSTPTDYCDNYGLCGGYGNCIMGEKSGLQMS
ncbi:S-locus glycoprotein domain containing protein, partial [Parasponia andersonii]